MIVTVSFVNGFQKTISEKVFNFWGHIRVQQYQTGQSVIAEETPVEQNSIVENILHKNLSVQGFQRFATLSGVVENNKQIEGILFKGIDENYDSSKIKQFIRQGRWLNFSNDSLYSKEIILSAPVANSLQIKLNDTVKVYFISSAQQQANYRKLIVCGIYKTGIDEYDKLFAIGDIKLIRRLNGWKPNEIGGYEVFLNNYKYLDTISKQLNNQLPAEWTSMNIKEIYPNIFDWLNVQDVNRNVVFIIMSIVAVINLITCLLILVLERTRMIGILKAVGINNFSVQKIFLFHATWIAVMGVLLGFAVGVGLCLLQQHFGIITLDEANYYVHVAPVQIIWQQIFLICAATIAVCFLALIIPTLFVRKIYPVQAIGFR